MIITAVIGLTTLMITMFIGVKWFLDDIKPTEKLPEKETIEKPHIPFNSTILGVIKSIEGSSIEVFDIEKKQNVSAEVESVTQVTDAYGKPIPESALQVGEIVQLVYEPKKEQLTSISKYMQAWTKSDMKTVKIDRSNRGLMIGQNLYKYNDYTVIVNAEDEPINSHQVGDYDVLELKGIDDTVYSIKVLEAQGYLEISHLPVNEGVLEIDINRQIPIGSITTPVPIGKGIHKIVIRIPGYEPMVTEISVEAGETFTLDLSETQQAYTVLTVQVLNTGVQYTITIDGVQYAQNEQIKLPVGSYSAQVTAEGYHPWEQTIHLTEPHMNLQVALQSIAPEADKEEENSTTEDTGSSTNDQAENTHKVTISTEPTGAKVYIDGAYKGETPYKTDLDLGKYTVTLEQEGYETYETSIILDNSDTQNNYLYMLIPKRN